MSEKTTLASAPRVLSAEEMRSLDRAAIDRFGVPSLTLMERAAQAVTVEALRMAGPTGRFVVICGAGNNAGDGLAAARLLEGEGREVSVHLIPPPDQLKGDALVNLKAWRECGGALSGLPPGPPAAGPGDVVIDAVFGTGLSRPAAGDYARAIELIEGARGQGARILAVDLPSGLSADTGQPLGPAVHADLTVTFALLKRGLVLLPGALYAGRVRVADIGIPPGAEAELAAPPVRLLTEEVVRGLVPPRPLDSHKGSFGHLLVLAGSPGRTGAANMSCAGAFRGGAGLVTLATRSGALEAAMGRLPELMGAPLPGEGPLALRDLPALLELARGKAALLIGPGLYRGPETGELLLRLLEQSRCPAVIDADGLNALAEAPRPLAHPPAPVIVTPHPGEMSRLSGRTVAEIQADRLGAARSLAEQRGLTVVLKGARTLVAEPSGCAYVNPTGNPGMATAGTGDVLAGLVGALLAQGFAQEVAATVGVFVHGLAGDRAARRTGQMGLMATDLLPAIGEVWAEWGR